MTLCKSCGYSDEQPLEQRIRDRIVFLENYIKINNIDIQALMPNARIDELRKLLPK